MADYNLLFDDLMVKEGGFGDSPRDVGNFCGGNLIGTNFGVAATAFNEYYGRCPTVSEMKNLSRDEAKKIWKKVIWDRMRGDEIKNLGVADLILYSTGGGSSGYLHTKQAINDSLGKKVVFENKKMFTKDEIATLNQIPPKKFMDSLYKRREQFFKSRPNSDVFEGGWMNRLNAVYNKALTTITENKSISVLVFIAALGLSYFLYRKFKK